MLKCNIDGVIFKNSNSIGISMILRDDTGSFVTAKSNYFNGLESVREVKITSLVEAIHWILFMGPLKRFLN